MPSPPVHYFQITMVRETIALIMNRGIRFAIVLVTWQKMVL